ncbi:SAV_2336 N-terminal domain-related protein [Streptomyces dangxiongensis]|uniref:SAV_2336 N-terminal domain-related protein n=1 Tax=Streptomyces dangxiongensis TaxID=1442032 RepID=UPI001F09BDD4|nr:SAV_2336 N-terminal domain-related protein [Streptomyces dangxiongensis]
MSSDRAGSPDPVVRLAGILAEAAHGVRPTPLELAELLWLAGHMSPGATDGETTGQPPAPEQAPPPPKPPPTRPPTDRPAPRPSRPADRDPAPAPARAPGPPSRVPLHLPSHLPAPAPAGRPRTTLLAPAPPMLRHPLALQRALRPLGRRVDAPVGRELDERATADRIARLGAAPEWWLPVLRPAQERWLRLNLVYDTGPTMPVWRPLIRELHTALAQSGTFRTVALYRAAADGTVRGADTHAPGDGGRTVTLLISDCMGPQWREGPAGTRWYATLRRWARRTPLAVVQPLPEHLWRDTALPATPGRLSAPHPVAPSATLMFTPYERHAHEPAVDTVPLPVLEPEPRWLAHWAALLTAPGGGEVPGAVAELGRPLPADAEDRTDVGALSAEELVLRFRATASPRGVPAGRPSRGGAPRPAGHAPGPGRRRTRTPPPAPGRDRPERHARHRPGAARPAPTPSGTGCGNCSCSACRAPPATAPPDSWNAWASSSTGGRAGRRASSGRRCPPRGARARRRRTTRSPRSARTACAGSR